MRFGTGAALGALLLAAVGCAPATRVVLLPQADKSASAVIVEARGEQAKLDHPHEEARVFTGKDELGYPYRPYELARAPSQQQQEVRIQQSTAEKVERRYGGLIAAAPPPAQRYTLYFELGSTQFTPESEAQVDSILQDAMQRPGGEIIITGHTDSVGDMGTNDALSLRRANAIREMFIKHGFDPMRVDAAGRGEREPLYPTDDGVSEPRNRRAEILVR